MEFLIGNMSDADEAVTCEDCAHKTDGSCTWGLAYQDGFALDCDDFDFYNNKGGKHNG